MEKQKIEKPILVMERLLYLFSGFAGVFTISITSFYIHASSILGHFPTYNNPDPKELDIYEVYQPIISFSAQVWFYSFFLWLILLIIYLFKTKRNFNKKTVITSLVFQSIPFLIFFSKIFEWYMD